MSSVFTQPALSRNSRFFVFRDCHNQESNSGHYKCETKQLANNSHHRAYYQIRSAARMCDIKRSISANDLVAAEPRRNSLDLI